MDLSNISQTIVFMQVGFDPFAENFVASIRKCMPRAKIVQCSDYSSAEVDGVSEVFRIKGDTQNLMTFRLQLFAELKLNQAAVYVDNDMLMLKELRIDRLLGDNDVVNCERYFGREDSFNINFKNMNLMQYAKKKLGEVYPILACFTVTRNFRYWVSCLDVLQKLDKKFHFWYGDQEAMKILVNSKEFKIGYVSEASVACLPEFLPQLPNAIALHFKGPNRKRLLSDFSKVYA